MMYLRPARFNTMHLVDTFLLEVELSARRVRCEVPHCSTQAVTLYGEELPAFLCATHGELCKKGMSANVKALLSEHLRRVVLEAANRAWAGTEDEVVFTYDPAVALNRYIDAPIVAPSQDAGPAQLGARPALPTLPIANVELPLLDFFPLS